MQWTAYKIWQIDVTKVTSNAIWCKNMGRLNNVIGERFNDMFSPTSFACRNPYIRYVHLMFTWCIMIMRFQQIKSSGLDYAPTFFRALALAVSTTIKFDWNSKYNSATNLRRIADEVNSVYYTSFILPAYRPVSDLSVHTSHNRRI